MMKKDGDIKLKRNCLCRSYIPSVMETVTENIECKGRIQPGER
jgi:hypothetical protein